jgi:hypothetical protein
MPNPSANNNCFPSSSGMPVLALACGRNRDSMVNRVGASVAKAAGTFQLVVHGLKELEALISKFATWSERESSVKASIPTSSGGPIRHYQDVILQQLSGADDMNKRWMSSYERLLRSAWEQRVAHSRGSIYNRYPHANN